jgi:hypothetical protein
VTFLASAPQGITVREWIWVSDRPPPSPPVATVDGATADEVDSARRLAWQTAVPSCGTLAQCKVPLSESGTMYVRARVNAPWQRRVEQASVVVTVQPLNLVLNCSPSSGVREYATTCTASTSPAVRPVTVQGWSFHPSDRSRQTDLPRVSNVQSKTWAGAIVAAGDVRVRALFGNRSDTASAQLTIMPRVPWSTADVPSSVIDSSQSGVVSFSNPTSQPGQLGSSWWVAHDDDHENTIGFVNDDGPNQGFRFFKQIPFRIRGRIAVNLVALSRGSAFVGIQDSIRTTNSSGQVICSRSDIIPRLLEQVYLHEGRSRYDPQSHYQTFMQAFEARGRADGEALVWNTVSRNPTDSVRIAWNDYANSESGRITDDTTNVPWAVHVRLGCRPRFF